MEFPVEFNAASKLISLTDIVNSNGHPLHLCNTLFLGLASDEPHVAADFQGQELLTFLQITPKENGQIDPMLTL